MLLAAAPRRSHLAAESPSLIAEEDPDWPEQAEPPGEPTPSPAQQLATALRELDLDTMTARQALIWLWEQQDRLLEETGEP